MRKGKENGRWYRVHQYYRSSGRRGEKIPRRPRRVFRPEYFKLYSGRHLICIVVMSGADAWDLIEPLTRAGLSHCQDQTSDIGLVHGDYCPDWLEVGMVQGQGACWLKGRPPGDLVEYPGQVFMRCPEDT